MPKITRNILLFLSLFAIASFCHPTIKKLSPKSFEYTDSEGTVRQINIEKDIGEIDYIAVIQLEVRTRYLIRTKDGKWFFHYEYVRVISQIEAIMESMKPQSGALPVLLDVGSESPVYSAQSRLIPHWDTVSIDLPSMTEDGESYIVIATLQGAPKFAYMFSGIYELVEASHF